VAATFEPDERIPARLRQLRRERGATLATVAERVGVSATHLSRLEKGERLPSVGLLLQLARSYGLTLSQLVGDEQPEAGCVVRGADAPMHPGAEVRYASMAAFPGLINVARVDVDPGRQTPTVDHPGEEWLYVLSGRASLHLGADALDLRAGDAAHFNSSLSHGIRNDSKEVLQLLIVSVAPVASNTHRFAVT
jgi:transcriptional regulator with XRE-family HTH domain